MSLFQALAQVDIKTTFGSSIGNTLTIGRLVNLLITTAMSLAGIIAIFLFIMGGYQVISGAGKGDSKSTEQGRQAITWAVIGFIVVFAAYWIIQIIEIIVGFDFITIPTNL